MLVVFLVVGCGRATIYLKRGEPVEGTIRKSDVTSIYVRPVIKCDKKNREHIGRKVCFSEVIAIARSNIRDIDHPGDYAAAVGGVIGGLGLGFTFLLWSGHQDCTDDCFASGIATGAIASPFLIIGAIGAVIGIGGLVTYAWSRNAAAPPKKKKTKPKVMPVALTDGERTYMGVGLSWSW
jgi:hypothetical protein